MTRKTRWGEMSETQRGWSMLILLLAISTYPDLGIVIVIGFYLFFIVER